MSGENHFAPRSMEEGRKLFTGEVTFSKGASSMKSLPKAPTPEIAFAGRSNVGKSSLINALTQRKLLARVSNTPGRTREINFFLVGEKFHLVDLPGYGYALGTKTKVEDFQQFTLDYLQDRYQLKRVFILIDSRHGLKPIDRQMMSLLDEYGQSYQIVLTKADKIKGLDEIIENIELVMHTHPHCFPRILLTSSRHNKGLEYLRAEIITLLKAKG